MSDLELGLQALLASQRPSRRSLTHDIACNGLTYTFAEMGRPPLLDVIKALAATGMTMLIVTHEVQFAREVADNVAVMMDGVIAEAALARASVTGVIEAFSA